VDSASTLVFELLFGWPMFLLGSDGQEVKNHKQRKIQGSRPVSNSIPRIFQVQTKK